MNVRIAMTIIPVSIKSIVQATPTIRVLTLDLGGHAFYYRAGQWIDCYAVIDGERKIVGYSLASSPAIIGSIEVAVKESDNHVTEYVHGAAQIGDIIYIEGGQGDVFYEEKLADKVVLIGAGIGVAPLMGILRYINDSTSVSATMIQSASSVEELLYYHEASEIADRNNRICYHASVTQGDPGEGFGRGRINRGRLLELEIDTGSLFFLSGPGGMIPEMVDTLRSMGVPDNRIKYEVWWKPSHDTM